MLGHESANAGQAGSNGGNGQGCGMEDAGRGIGDRENSLFMRCDYGISCVNDMIGYFIKIKANHKSG